MSSTRNDFSSDNSPLESEAIVLVKRPQGEPKPEDFRTERHPLPELKEGEVLVKAKWLSLDPYMRGTMKEGKSYTAPVPIGGVLKGQTAGEIIASKSRKFAVGDKVTVYSGWQSYYVTNEDDELLRKITTEDLPLSVFLGAAGMPGRTAYFGLLKLGRPKAGETIVVSAAAGAVGSVVGQIAKHMGCHVVGVAGGQAKCDYVLNELGFDICVDYKAGNLDEDMKRACPNGIDIYFENVGGAVTRAVAPLLNKGSRAPICGYISLYNEDNIEAVETPFDIFGALPEPPEHRFFLVSEWDDEYQECTDQLVAWIREGKIKYHETIADGLENAVDAFIGMLRGKNLGKQVVRISN